MGCQRKLTADINATAHRIVHQQPHIHGDVTIVASGLPWTAPHHTKPHIIVNHHDGDRCGAGSHHSGRISPLRHRGRVRWCLASPVGGECRCWLGICFIPWVQRKLQIRYIVKFSA
jgi:hypothetical protein